MPDSLSNDLQRSLGAAYSLTRELGGGGMSHVFLAKDAQFDRDVVVKVLPPDAAAALSVDRFRREIALAAKLQHPHIVPLLGAGETAGGLPYYTMPFVEGESLRQRLVREGELPIAESVGILREVTRALGYAHEHGVVHRDIKPDNVMLSGGSAMVTDFGVAKALKAATDTGGGGRGNTITQLGMSLGTPAYMSPEQAAGDPNVDQRTDIYALGCMAYEMLTGHPPFTARNAPAMIAAQVSEKPEDILRRRPNLPPALAILVMQCLEKRPADRPHDARDVLRTLDGIVVTPSGIASVMLPSYTAEKSSSSRRGKLIAAGVVLAIALGAGALALRAATTSQAAAGSGMIARFSVPFPEGWSMCPAGNGSPQVALAPDGSRIAICAQRADTNQVFERRLDELEWKPVAGTEFANGVNFSSDSKYILSRTLTERRIVRIPVDGSPAATLASNVAFGEGTLGADGVLYFTPGYNTGLMKVTAPGATPTVFTTRDSSHNELGHWWPQILPDGRHILFSGYSSPLQKARIEIVSTADGKPVTLIEGGTNARYAAGYLFFAKGDILHAAPFSLGRSSITGTVQPVLEGIGSKTASGDAWYSVAENGTLAYMPTDAVSPAAEIVWADRTGHMTPVLARHAAYSSARLSHDGRIAMLIHDHGYDNLWVHDPARETFTAISRRDAETLAGVWSPDGKTLYYGVEDPTYQLYARASDASAPERTLQKTTFDKYPLDASPDGRMLLIRSSPGDHSRIATVLTDGSGGVTEVVGGDGEKAEGAFSPDGHWVAYVSDESGRREVYVRSWPDVSRARWQVSTAGGIQPRWARSGREILFRSDDRMMSSSINAAGGKPEKPVTLFTAPGTDTDFDVSADGSRFLMIRRVNSSSSLPHVIVVTNWIQSLAKKF